MSYTFNKCKEEMGNDNSGCFTDWPKPKKSKTEEVHTPKWEYLPSVILHDVFSNLELKDRINASSTCHMWRNSLYHPNFWQNVTFQIKPHTIPKVQYLRSVVGHIVTNATVQFNSMNFECVTEFLQLLQQFKFNDNLQSLIIKPSHSHIVLPPWDIFSDGTSPVITYLFNICCHKPLSELSLGLNEELLQDTTKYLELLAKLRPEKVRLLGLASLKDEPGNYLINNCDPALFMPFNKLKILSIDYDVLNDGLLKSLKNASELERLVVHVHGIWEGHPGTTEATWMEFKKEHPKCLLRISLIHAFDEVNHFQDQILRNNMPLSHLKVLFCENINLAALDILARYGETLRSVMWVDSLCHDECSWKIITYMEESDHMDPAAPDPFVILSWVCKKLEEIILIGYKYQEEDLLAIARLRGTGLKRLEIAYDDVLTEAGEDVNNKNIKEISNLLGQAWSPKTTEELHPVFKDPLSGDSDEYLMPILLSDIQ